MPGKDLNDIYDGGFGPGDDQNPIPKVNQKGYDPFKSFAESQPTRHSTPTLGAYADIDVSKYAPQYDRHGLGITNPKTNAVDNDIMLGNMQSAWDKGGNWTARVVAKIGTGLVEGIGYAGALLTEWGDDRDYSNGLTQLAQGWNKSLDEALPIYRTSNKTWGFGDLGWWLQNTEGLVSSVASFYTGGLILSSLAKASKLGKGLELLASIGSRDAAFNKFIGNAGEQLFTAGGLAYIEGAQSGNRVFGEVYNTQYQKALAQGLPPDEADLKARYIAAQSAATTVQLNTMINTGLNMYSVLPFFNHEEQVIEDIAKKHFFQQSGESIADWGKRVGGYTIDKFKKQAFKGEGKIAAIREAGMEGVEELTNQFAERTGLEEGKEGRTHGMLRQLGQLSKYFDRTMDSEGALNFVMGAIAGPMTNVVTTNIPRHKVQTGYYQDASGNFTDKAGNVLEQGAEPVAQYKVMTSRAKNKFGNTNYFNNIKDAIEEDIKYFQDKQDKIQKSRQQGNHSEADKLTKELFDLQSRRAVQLGFADNLKETYRQIADLDNTKIERDDLKVRINDLQTKIDNGDSSPETSTELQQLTEQYEKTPDQSAAMRMGFAKDINDTTYQSKAKEAIEDLDYLQKLHDKVMRKYGMESRTIGSKDTEADPLQVHLSDFIFDRYARLYLMNKQANKWNQKIAELQGQQNMLSDVIGGNDLIEQQKQQQEYSRLRTRYVGTHATIVAEDELLQKAQTNPTKANIEAAQDILEKYGALGVTAEDVPKAITDTRNKLHRISENINNSLKQANDNILNSTGYNEWVKKNPGKTFQDYNAEVDKKYGLSEEEKFLQTNLESLNAQIQTHTESLNDLESSRTMNRIMKSTQDWWDKLAKERKNYLEAQNTIIEQRQKNQQNIAKLESLRLKTLRNNYVKEMETVQNRMEQINNRLSKLQEELDKFLNSEGIVYLDTTKKQQKYHEYIQEANELRQELQNLTDRFNVLQSATEKVEQQLNNTKNVPKSEVVKEDAPVDDGGNVEAGNDMVSSTPEFQDTSTTELQPIGQELLQDVKTYDTLKAELPKDVQHQLELYEQQLRLGEREFSYDALNPPTTVGTITMEEAANVLQALKDTLDAEDSLVKDVDTTIKLSETIIEQPVPEQLELEQDSVESAILNADSLVTDNTEVDVLYLPTTEERTFAGAKTIEAASTLAGMDLEYDEDFNEAKNQYFKEALTSLNENTHTSIFDPKGLTPGTKLLIVIDDKYDGAKNNHHKLTMDDYGHRILGTEKFEDYLDENGKIRLDDKSIGNVPIKVVNEKGETIRYIRTTDWITAKYDATAGPEGYRNVYDGSDEEGDIPTGNVQRQAALNLELRRKLIAKYNQGETEGTLIEVTDKGAGMVILNREKSEVFGQQGKVVWDKASTLLPDTTLTIGIKQGDKILIDTGGKVTDKEVVTKLPQYLQNRAVFLLPGNNGKYHAAVAKGVNLMNNNVAINTISKAIELHLLNDTTHKDVTKILDKTGFDVTTVKGLKGFINQYFTHTTNWTATKVDEQGKEVSVLDIQEATNTEFNNRILIGTISPIGVKEVTASLTNGVLSTDFKQALQRLLSERLKNVVFSKPELGIRGINEQAITPFIEPRANSKGELSFHEHSNYNKYIKNHLIVNVFGQNKVSTTDRRDRKAEMYVYSVNPKIEFDATSIAQGPKVTKAVDTTLPHPEVTPVTKTEDLASIFEDIADMNFEVSDTFTIDGIEVTKDNLLKLANLAPETRNGKSVDEVYNYLVSNGITTLYNGFNPFLKCN